MRELGICQTWISLDWRGVQVGLGAGGATDPAVKSRLAQLVVQRQASRRRAHTHGLPPHPDAMTHDPRAR
eukprot:3143158-Rhodomonas_salina.4